MLIKINGRLQYFSSDRIRAIKRVSRGEYRLESTIGTYRIVGGRHAGGSPRDWFLEPIGETAIFRGASNGPRYINARSVVDAVRLVEGA